MASIMCCTCIFATFYSSKEPSVYGAECTLNTIPDLAEGNIDTLFPFRDLTATGILCA